MIRVIHGKIELLTAFELRRQIFRVYIELSMKSARAKISDQISAFSPKFFIFENFMVMGIKQRHFDHR